MNGNDFIWICLLVLFGRCVGLVDCERAAGVVWLCSVSTRPSVSADAGRGGAYCLSYEYTFALYTKRYSESKKKGAPDADYMHRNGPL